MGIVIVLLITVLMSAISAALVLTAATEVTIAGHFQRVQEARFAAAGALEAAIGGLRRLPGWGGVLDGSVRSPTADGLPAGVRMVAGQAVDLGQLRSLLECGLLTPCTDGSVAAVTADRPWGVNNPRWRLFHYGPWAGLARAPSAFYVVVLVADDPMEQDGDPSRDSPIGAPGTGRARVRTEAFGPAGAHAAVEALVERNALDSSVIRMLAWHFTVPGAPGSP